MTDWQITAKTIFCEAVDDEVTVMVYKNASARCTGCKKYSEPNAITQATIKEKSRRLQRPIKCEGENCARVTAYKTAILAAEPQ
jgi:hypothetical protein